MGGREAVVITAEQALAIEKLHSAFVRQQVAKGLDGPVPPGRKTHSDYNLHVPEMESSGDDWDIFDFKVRRVLGLDPVGPAWAVGRSQADITAKIEDFLTRAAGHDTTPGHDQLHHYWVAGPGLAEWLPSKHQFTTLRDLLVEHAKVPAEVADKWAASWVHEVTGAWPGSDVHRVEEGGKPRGDRIGPG